MLTSERWEELSAVLRNHSEKKRESTEQSLNRLIKKSIEFRSDPARPVLSKATVHIAKEKRSTAQLEKLLGVERVTSRPSFNTEGPVVVFSHGGREALLDGGRRINHWVRTKDENDHWVLLVSVART